MTQALRLRLIYDGKGPVIWTPAPSAADAFGLQDKAAALHPGSPGPGGAVVFEFTLGAKLAEDGAIVLSGDFAHGPPAARFLYLGWRNAAGHFAQRLKIPLAGITGELATRSQQSQQPVTARLVDHAPKATRTGENIGGTRVVEWTLR